MSGELVSSGSSNTLLSDVFSGNEKYISSTYRSSRPEVFCKKVVLRNFTKFTGKHLCQSIFFNKVAGHQRFSDVFRGYRNVTCNFIKKDTLALVFSCESCEISKSTFFIKHFWWLLLYSKIRKK